MATKQVSGYISGQYETLFQNNFFFQLRMVAGTHLLSQQWGVRGRKIKFKARLVYTVSSRVARDAWEVCLKQNKINTLTFSNK